jgi:hypothetical protein
LNYLGQEEKMGIRIIAKMSVLLVMALLSGCGSPGQTTISQSGSSSEPIKGAVIGGAVQGALVFADHLYVASGKANRKLDADEPAAVTDANGNFTIPSTPSYAYLLVTQGGTDSITFQPTMQMVAMAGAKNVSPLTTMVAYDDSNSSPTVQATIETLGIPYDENIYNNVTPAAALLVQSTQSIVVALTRVLNPGGNSLPVAQLNLIQLIILHNIGINIRAKSVADLTTPATLTTTLTTAIGVALSDIQNYYSTQTSPHADINVIDTSLTNDIVSPIVTAVAAAITASQSGVSLSDTTTTYSESTLITSGGAVTINTAITNAAAIAAGKITVTPPAPPFPTPVISGTPATKIAVSKTYSFKPTASDPGGNLLVFSIVNKPAWATFNPGTGALTGTPTSYDVATTTNIVITVSNGVNSASLPSFSLEVYVPSGSPGGTGL